MGYLDEELISAKKEIKKQKYTTIETGIYVKDALLTFSEFELTDLGICVFLPNSFIKMPDQVKKIKYPSKDAPEFIYTSLDSTVNIGFNALQMEMDNEQLRQLNVQFQQALINVNPSIRIEQNKQSETKNGGKIYWFDFKGYCLDGQSYNRFMLIQMDTIILHCIFNCHMEDEDNWQSIIEALIETVRLQKE